MSSKTPFNPLATNNSVTAAGNNGLPARALKYATSPATSGLACQPLLVEEVTMGIDKLSHTMEVPDRLVSAVSLEIPALMMCTPGANRSSTEP